MLYSSLASMITDNDLLSDNTEHNQIKTILHHRVLNGSNFYPAVEVFCEGIKTFPLNDSTLTLECVDRYLEISGDF